MCPTTHNLPQPPNTFFYLLKPASVLGAAGHSTWHTFTPALRSYDAVPPCEGAVIHCLLLGVRAMYQTRDEYREYLEELSYEELLGEEFLQSVAEDDIDSRLDAIRSELEMLDYEELLGHDYLDDLAQAEIESRLAAFDEEESIEQ